MKKKYWRVIFEINFGEYFVDDMVIEATTLGFSYEENFIDADGVIIRFDNKLVKVYEVNEE